MNPVDVPSRRDAWAGAVCLVVGATAVLVQWLVTPVDDRLGAQALVAKVAEHHTAMTWSLVLDVPFLLVVPAVLYAGRLAGSRTSLFAGITTALCFVPQLYAILLVGADVLLFEASTQPDRHAAAALVSAYENNWLVGGSTVVYLVTHAIGFVMLAAVLHRVRAVPTWAVLALAVWPFLEMGGYAAGGKVLAAVGYAALLAGYAACAGVLVRRSRGTTGTAPTDEPALSMS